VKITAKINDLDNGLIETKTVNIKIKKRIRTATVLTLPS
jgi:hypothetical protein